MLDHDVEMLVHHPWRRSWGCGRIS